MDKLSRTTTHSIPYEISPSEGNSRYKKLQNILKEEPNGGAIIGVMCGVIALLNGDILTKNTNVESKYTYGDASVRTLSNSFFFTIKELFPSKSDEKLKFSHFIHHELIPSGFEIITESRYSDICDLILNTLDEVE